MCPQAAKQVLIFLTCFTVTITTFQWCLFVQRELASSWNMGVLVAHSQLRLLCDRCDFFFKSALHKSHEPQRWGRGLGEECGPSQKYKPPWCQTKAPVFTEIQPQYSTFYIPFRLGGYFAKRGGIEDGGKKLLKLPTFSAQRARHSEQHGRDKQQTSRRLHLLRPSASSPYSKDSWFILFPNVKNAVFWLPVISRLAFWHLCSSRSFSNLSGFLPGIPCLVVVKRDSAQEQRRAPVKAWVGSGRLTQPALTSSYLQASVLPLTLCSAQWWRTYQDPSHKSCILNIIFFFFFI